MSNLVRQYYVTNDNTPKRVVNKNNKFEARMREIEELQKQQERIRQIVGEDASDMQTMDEGLSMSEDGFIQGIDALQVATRESYGEDEATMAEDEYNDTVDSTNGSTNAMAEELMEDARRLAEEIVAEAQEQADAILAEAQAKAEELYEEKRKQGYEEGSNEKLEEIMRMKEEVQTQIDLEREKLESEFSSKADEMEKDIVEAMIEVFDRVFHIQFDNKKEMLLHLIKNTLMNVEVGREFRIHVAQNNYKFLLAHLGDVRERVGNDVEIEIVNDANLGSADCQIETSYGIFDCGIDMELSNLVKDIRSLCS